MSSKTIPLTGAQINTLKSLADDPHLSPDFAKMGEENLNLRVFVVNFDVAAGRLLGGRGDGWLCPPSD